MVAGCALDGTEVIPLSVLEFGESVVSDIKKLRTSIDVERAF